MSVVKKLSIVLTMVIAVFVISNINLQYSHAGLHNLIGGYDLNDAGTVTATYYPNQALRIEGHGTIQRDKWIGMMKTINPANGGNDIRYMWKQNMLVKMEFKSTSNTQRIKLPEDASGFFSNYRGPLIVFDDFGLDTSQVKNMSYLFYKAAFNNIPGTLDTSNATNMANMYGYSGFNEVPHLDTSKVEDMSGMFAGLVWYNKPITLDTSNVKNMSAMFSNSRTFNSPINFSDTSKVTDMSYMFYNAQKFNQPLNFNTSSVKKFDGMFWTAINFNKPLNFDTSNATNMAHMFENAYAFNQKFVYDDGGGEQPWDLSNVTDMTKFLMNGRDYSYDINFEVPSIIKSQGLLADSAYKKHIKHITVRGTNPLSGDHKSIFTLNQTTPYLERLEFDENLVPHINDFGVDYGVYEVDQFGNETIIDAQFKDEYYKFKHKKHYIVKQAYLLKYYGNGNTGGNVPDKVVNKLSGQPVTIVGNPNNLTRTGFEFKCWNTKPDGSGDDYGPYDGMNKTYILTQGLKLYAKWGPKTYTITYDGNSSDDDNNVPVAGTKTHGTDFDVATQGNLTKVGHDFAGWTENQDGSGTLYKNGGTLYQTDEDVTLYAKWEPKTYTVTYNGNLSDNDNNKPADGTKTYGVDFDVATQGALTKTGYDFVGWTENQDGSGTVYKNGVTPYQTNADVTLYAKWQLKTYTVKYDGNGFTGGTVPPDDTKEYNKQLNVAGQGDLVKTGHLLCGWTENQDGSGTVYRRDMVYYTSNKATTLYAKWNPKTYPVTYHKSAGDLGAIPTNQTKTHGVDLTLQNNINNLNRPCCNFVGWNTDVDGTGTDYPEGGTYTLDAPLDLYPKWQKKTYTITYQKGAGVTGNLPANQTKTYDVDINLQTNTGTLAKTGFAFDGWNTSEDGSGTTYSENGVYTDNSNLTLYPKWSKLKYTITYKKGAGVTGNLPANQTKDYDVDINLQTNTGTLAKTGFAFDGWNTAEDGNGTSYSENEAYTVNSDLTLYPKWSKLKYTITYQKGIGVTGNLPANQIKTYGVDINLQTNTGGLAKTGYNFDGWNTAEDGSGTSYIASGVYSIDSNVTLYPKWKKANYTITYDGNQSDNDNNKPVDGTKIHGTDFDVATQGNLTKTGYNFVGWTKNQNGSGTLYKNGGTLYQTDADVTLYAKWEPKTYTVTYNGNLSDNDNNKPADGTKTYGVDFDVATQGALIKTGYDFVGWTENQNGSGILYKKGDTLYQTNADVTLYAKWQLKTYVIKYDVKGATGTVPSDDTKEYNKQLNVAGQGDLVKTGHLLCGWTENQDGSGTVYRRDMVYYTSNKATTLYAKWNPKTYPVTYHKSAGDLGAIPTNQTKTHGVDLTLQNNTNSLNRNGFDFVGWNTDVDGTGTDYAAGGTYTLDAPLDLYPKWQIKSYTITYKKGLAKTGSVPASQTQNYNTIVTLSGNTGNLKRSGYIFSGWNTNSDGTGQSYGAGTNYKIIGDETLYPKWKKNKHKISYGKGTATSGVLPVDQIKIDGTNITLPGNTGNLTKTGYTFNGWNTKADGTGTHYSAGSQFTTDSDTTLYPDWKKTKYKISYGKGTATSGVLPVNQIKRDGTNITLPGNTGNLTKTGYTFNGWNTKADGTGTHYAAGSQFTTDSNTTLYPDWEKTKYNISYGKGTATGGVLPVNQIKTDGTNITLPGNTGNLTKTGYTFNGWNTKADGTGTHYPVGSQFTTDSDTKLYPDWKQNSGRTSSSSRSSGRNTNNGNTVSNNSVIQTIGTPNAGNQENLSVQSTDVNSGTQNNQEGLFFEDVNQNDWFNKSVYKVARKGLMNGTEKNKFSPNTGTTRAMIATILYRLSGEDKVSDNIKFSDVKENQWYTEGIKWGTKNKVLKGYEDGNFRPDQVITRQELVSMIHRYSNHKKYNTTEKADLNKFVDGKVVYQYAKNPMEWSVAKGLIEGIGDNMIAPLHGTTRAQLATLFNRYIDKFEATNQDLKLSAETGMNAEIINSEKALVAEEVPNPKAPEIEFIEQQGADGEINFEDVKKDDWFNNSVYDIARKGLMNGTSRKTFSPNLGTTRAMIATILYRLSEEDKVSDNIKFPDVKDGQWYTEGIRWGTKHGILKGYGDGNFRPEKVISREELVAMIHRYSSYKKYDITEKADLSKFIDDEDIDGYAITPMEWSVAKGLIEGIGDNMIAPRYGTTRAQLATLFNRYINKITEK